MPRARASLATEPGAVQRTDTRNPSEQVGGTHTLPVQMLDWQSPLPLHIAPPPQRCVQIVPPQSTPVSVPFRTVSVQDGATHTFAVQTPFRQSVASAHTLLVVHFEQSGPPQSVSISAPFFTLSMQVGITQIPEAHARLVQSRGRLQPHGPQLPPQSTESSSPFFCPSAQLGATHVPA